MFIWEIRVTMIVLKREWRFAHAQQRRPEVLQHAGLPFNTPKEFSVLLRCAALASRCRCSLIISTTSLKSHHHHLIIIREQRQKHHDSRAVTVRLARALQKMHSWSSVSNEDEWNAFERGWIWTEEAAPVWMWTYLPSPEHHDIVTLTEGFSLYFTMVSFLALDAVI